MPICRIVRLFGWMLVATSAIAQASGRQIEPDASGVQALLEGVTSIAEPGTVGQIAVWGSNARAIAVGQTGDTQRPIAAMSTLGKGRVVAFAHGYLSSNAASTRDTGQLILNACSWLAKPLHVEGDSPPRIGLLRCDLAAFLNDNGFATVELGDDATLAKRLRDERVVAVLLDSGDLTNEGVAAIQEYVRNGGGFMCAACPWGWAQVRKTEVSHIPLNRILAPAGMAFTDGTVDGTLDNGFDTAAVPGDVFTGIGALRLLSDVESGEVNANRELTRQAGATLAHAAGAIPPEDQILRPTLLEMLAERSEHLAPTPEQPMRSDRALDRALLAMQVAEIERMPADAVVAHASAASFPGAVPAEAPRVRAERVIDCSVPGWHSTGLYAAPGEVIRVALNERATSIGLRVRIGCHKDQLWHLARWDRVPRITQTWPLDAQNLAIASAFGGLLYIEVPDACDAAAVHLAVEGVVEAPLFEFGRTTNHDWNEHVRLRPGPWAEFSSDRLILTVPSEFARSVDDPHALMEHWVRVLDACADLATIPRDRRRPERIVTDVQISAGYMHSGYPIMTHLDAAAFMTDLDKLARHGWGPYHELGHNHQEGEWTFAGTGEVTCNLFTLYILEVVCGTPVDRSGRVLDDQSLKKMHQHLQEDGKWERWKRDPFLALQMYALMQHEFGWDAFKKVFAEYRALSREQRPRSDEQKRDQWLTRFSRTVGRNLGPYFEAWGVPTSEAARQSIADLPTWLPAEMPSPESSGSNIIPR